MIEYGIVVERIDRDTEPPVLTYKFFGPEGSPEIIYRQEAAVSSQRFTGTETIKSYYPLEEEAARVQVLNRMFRDGGWQFKTSESRGVDTYNARSAPYSRPHIVFLTFERNWGSDD